MSFFRIISYRVDINMRFRTSSSNGLLLWSGRQSDPLEDEDANNDFLSLALDQGFLTLSYNLGSGEAEVRYNLTRLDDDLWHRIRAVRQEHFRNFIAHRLHLFFPFYFLLKIYRKLIIQFSWKHFANCPILLKLLQKLIIHFY